MRHISISQKIELIKEHKELLVDLLEREIGRQEDYRHRYKSKMSGKDVNDGYSKKILNLREVQAIINNF